MPKRPRGNEWGGGGAHQRFGRRSRGSGDAEADHGDKVAGTEIHDEVETVLHRLPDGVVRHALSFLAGVCGFRTQTHSWLFDYAAFRIGLKASTGRLARLSSFPRTV